MRPTTYIATLAVAGLLTGACQSTDDTAADGTVEVVGVDYGFEGVDDPIAAGSTLVFRNDSDAEFHEMVVMRVTDGEDRSVEELLELPDEEGMGALAFVGVAAAAPGDTGDLIDGDLELTEAGRYLLVCFIPVGADPDAVAEAFSGEIGDEPPDLGDGPPHATTGMAIDLFVQ